MQSKLHHPPSLTSLGRYTIVRSIGSGGMGEVFLGVNRGAAGVDKQVVIKHILPHLARNSEFIHRFIDEARLVSQLSHGNIVQVYEMGKEGDTLFIAMEYVDGLDLQQMLALSTDYSLPVPAFLVAYIAREICQALDYAHKKSDPSGAPLNLIHRDVSPSNILISQEGLVKLTDFGVAKARGRTFGTITGSLKGKLSYMSPEQAAGHRIDARSDLFSLGVVLWEALTGRRLFTGDSEPEILRNIKESHIPSPGSVAARIPEELGMITMKALAREPQDRYQSAQAMEEDLTALLMGRRDEAGPEALGNHLRMILTRKGAGPGGTSQPGGTPPYPLCFDDALKSQLEQASGPSPGLPPSAGHTPAGPTRSGPWSTPGHQVPGPPPKYHPQEGTRLNRRYLHRSRVALILALFLSMSALAIAHFQSWKANQTHRSGAEATLQTPGNQVHPPRHGEHSPSVHAPQPPVDPDRPPVIAAQTQGAAQPGQGTQDAGPSEPAPARLPGPTQQTGKTGRPGTDREGAASPSGLVDPKSVPTAPGTGLPPSSPPPAAPTAHATPPTDGEALPEARPGYLNLRIWPWGMIKIGDTIHESPLMDHPLPPGEYRIQVYNDNFNFDQWITVEIDSQETTTQVIHVNRTGDN